VSVYLVVLALTLAQFGAANTGELHLVVTDSSGLPLVSVVELVSEAQQVHQFLATDADGVAIVRRLPIGAYQVAVTRDGFARFTGLVEIRSALPTDYRVTMTLAAVQAQVTVTAGDTLVDLHQTATTHRIGADTLQRRATALPGRSIPDLVNTQPGWLLEANGILHPRGSEYQTQSQSGSGNQASLEIKYAGPPPRSHGRTLGIRWLCVRRAHDARQRPTVASSSDSVLSNT